MSDARTLLSGEQFAILSAISGAALFTSAAIYYRSIASKLEAMRDLPPGSILHEESFASGRSHKNWLTRFGGAGNCLKITVTFHHLYVRPIFPFVYFGGALDLIHIIPISAIQRIEERGSALWKKVLIGYTAPEGGHNTIELFPKHRGEFKSAIDTARTAAESMTAVTPPSR